MTAVEIRERLLELSRERAVAEDSGLDSNRVYMAHLEAEVRAYRLALVGAQVTDIAVIRGELLGRDVG